jgi:hypothetical protein
MSRILSPVAGAVAALAAAAALAQPAPKTDQATGAVNPYVYMSNAKGDKVLVDTRLWRADMEYDVRALRRFMAVIATLEKMGFKINEQISIDWNKKADYVRCAIYLESKQAGRQGRTGARTFCDESGLGEFTVFPSDDPKHVETVMKRFDTHYAGAKRRLGK